MFNSALTPSMAMADLHLGVGGASSLPALAYGVVPGPRPERPFPVVRLRGLPFSATEQDVAEFFQGLDPVDTLLVRRDGRAAGEAYVLFGTTLQMDFALNKNRQMMGRRYIEVFKARKGDYYNAVAAFVADPPPATYGEEEGAPRAVAAPPPRLLGGDPPAHTLVLKLRGLPFTATKDDIISFFDDVGAAPLVHDSIHCVEQNGRFNGTAFAEFASEGDAKLALRKDRSRMGGRYIELFASSREEATRQAMNGR